MLQGCDNTPKMLAKASGVLQINFSLSGRQALLQGRHNTSQWPRQALTVRKGFKVPEHTAMGSVSQGAATQLET